MDKSDFGIRSIDLMEQKGRTSIIYGMAGRGKTTLLNTLKGNVLLINIDCGEQVLNPHSDQNTFDICALISRNQTDPIGSIKKFEAFVDFLLSQEKLEWDYIVVDNISEIQDTYIEAIGKARGKKYPERLIYRDTGIDMLRVLKKMRNLTYKGVDVIYIAWEATEKIEDFGGEVHSEKGPMIMGKTQSKISGLVDFVMALRVDKKGDRFLQLDADHKYSCKKRTEPGKTYPNVIECPKDATDTLQTFFDLVHKEVK
jgi:phage nucleotide-binding protein